MYLFYFIFFGLSGGGDDQIFTNKFIILFQLNDLDSPKDEVSNIKSETNSILFRATDGQSEKNKKIKFSTIVNVDDIDSFWIKYTDVVKKGMTGLRKKEKKKKNKSKITNAQKK